MNATCPQCGAPVQDGASFCNACGGPIPAGQTLGDAGAAAKKPTSAIIWALAFWPLAYPTVCMASGTVHVLAYVVLLGLTYLAVLGLLILDPYILLKGVGSRQLLAKHGYSAMSLRLWAVLFYPVYMFKRAKLLGQTQIHLIAWGVALIAGTCIFVAGYESTSYGGLLNDSGASSEVGAISAGNPYGFLCDEKRWNEKLRSGSQNATEVSDIIKEFEASPYSYELRSEILNLTGTISGTEREETLRIRETRRVWKTSREETQGWCFYVDGILAVHGGNQPLGLKIGERVVFEGKVHRWFYSKWDKLGPFCIVPVINLTRESPYAKYTKILAIAKEANASPRATYHKYMEKRLNLMGTIDSVDYTDWGDGRASLVVHVDGMYCNFSDVRPMPKGLKKGERVAFEGEIADNEIDDRLHIDNIKNFVRNPK
jgi:hypothetical protein